MSYQIQADTYCLRDGMFRFIVHYLPDASLSNQLMISTSKPTFICFSIEFTGFSTPSFFKF